MTPLKEALVSLDAALAKAGIDHMLIGGMAYSILAEPRYTSDVDFLLDIPDESIHRLVELLGSLGCKFLVEEPALYAQRARCLPFTYSNGIRADFLFNSTEYERTAIERALIIEYEGRSVRLCRPEDFILLKYTSTRGKDWDDIEGVLLRQLPGLDLEYLEPRLKELTEAFESPDLWERWIQLKAGVPPGRQD